MKNLLILVLCFSLNATAKPLVITSLSAITGSSVHRYQRFEIGVQLSQVFANPYDSGQVNVWAVFTSPAGKQYIANGFWYQPYSRCSTCYDPTNKSDSCNRYWDTIEVENITGSYLSRVSTGYPFRIRFAPDDTGTWQYKVYARSAAGADSTALNSFTVTASADKGYIKVAPSHSTFCYNDGTVFIPIGTNCIDGGGVDSVYDRIPMVLATRLITQMSPYGGNLLRLFMAPNNLNIEWVDTLGNKTIGNYDNRQDRAFDMDSILSAAEQNNVYIQLITDVQSELNSGLPTWDYNPYNSKNGGFVSNSDSFFTDDACINAYKQKLRYIIARWGYSPHILSYEMFQEIDQYNEGDFWDSAQYSHIVNWFQTMIQYGKSQNPNAMFVISGTSPAAGAIYGANSLFNIPELDYINEHSYLGDYNTEFQRNYIEREDRGKFPAKPMFFGEMGAAVWGGRFDVETGTFEDSPKTYNVELHNSLWSTLFGGAAGPGVIWMNFETLVHPSQSCYGGQYAYFKPISIFLNDETLFSAPLQPIANFCRGRGPKDYHYYDTAGSCLRCNPDSISGDSCNCIPTWYEIEDVIYPAYISTGVLTTNDSLIEVFGLKNSHRAIGWVHNKQNYWYPLRHNVVADSADAAFLNDNQTPLGRTYPGQIPYLQNDSISIIGLATGKYKVEFYSTYPSYDTSGAGAYANGGIISKFTLNAVTVPRNSDTIKFPIPLMKALAPYDTSAPYAPDYGFKVTWLGTPGDR